MQTCCSPCKLQSRIFSHQMSSTSPAVPAPSEKLHSTLEGRHRWRVAILRRSAPALAHHVITATRCEPSMMGVRFWGQNRRALVTLEFRLLTDAVEKGA
jgi:hypothetical protein